MRGLRNNSIKRKLTILSVLTTGVALFVACVILLVYERAAFRQTIHRDQAVLAEMLAGHISPGLIFSDSKSIAHALSTLGADSRIMGSCVFDAKGLIVARYERADLKGRFPFPETPPAGQIFETELLSCCKRISFAGDYIGAVYLACDLNDLSERLQYYAGVVIFILCVSSLLVFFISIRFQVIILEPILALALVARKVAAKKDYSVRVKENNGDEMGELTKGFNEMLSQIQQRDVDLMVAGVNLEKRVEERTSELAASVSLLNATLESTTDGILAINNCAKVTCQNSKFATFWGYDTETVGRQDGLEMISLAARQVKNPEEFLARVDQSMQQQKDAFYVIELKDGRTFEQFVHPQQINGRTVGLVVNMRDVTARKRAEAEMEMMHKELLEISRKAGMAEVATGVLHNVGNVLNSVNVSTSVMSDKIKKSKVSSLTRLAELLSAHQDDLESFVTADRRGKLLPVFVAQLAESISTEQRSFSTELEQLEKNVEHIKDIVSMQQSYAKIAGVNQSVELPDLVEDSLKMNAGSLERHQIQIIKLFEKAPTVHLEKHKVLQILVNLIRNAQYACDDAKRIDKRITISITREDGTARISVSDNGIGIPKENITRIFAHGFTTRANGHGFGLHTGALAAREMGGSLVAKSEGIGQGATFILELPIKQ